MDNNNNDRNTWWGESWFDVWKIWARNKPPQKDIGYWTVEANEKKEVVWKFRQPEEPK